MSQHITDSLQCATILDTFRHTVAHRLDSPALVYFDTALSAAELDAASDALAAALQPDVSHQQRVALYLQNMPQYVIALLAVWKLNATAVPLNPMLTPHEVTKLVDDATPQVLIGLDTLCTDALMDALAHTSVRRVITTSALDLQRSGDHRVLPSTRLATRPGTEDLMLLIERHRGRTVAGPPPRADDVAVITYTSGTTGKPKGAMNTHRNVLTGGDAYRQWFSLDADDAILGVAPLFHVTGLSGHIAVAITAGAPLILSYRFDVGVISDMVRTHRPTFTVAALTVFIALLEAGVSREDLHSLTKIASGGAPVAAGVLDRFVQRYGTYVHNVYGMTETTSPVLAVPVGSQAPVDAQTSALSVGKPVLSASVTVLDEDGNPAHSGQVGEIATTGPQIVPGYFNQPEQTAAAFRGKWLLTGDVGYVDDEGWFYLVDRKKDVIVASGYKVWPREVEDVLYTHPAVREAAVVGEPDAYRGETVKAFVSVRDGATVDEQELITHCRERLAAYKYPRAVEFLDDIPKTATGKILRRNLRDAAAAAPAQS
jgi:long-chain acyl-CoA synthetase